jgi:glycosyltransferase involved in cell wall biosynthesis
MKASQPLHVAIVTHEPFWPPSGGGSSQAPFLAETLLSRGHRISLFCPCTPQERRVISDRFPLDVVPFDRYPMGRRTSMRTLKYLAFPWFMEKLLVRRHRNDRMDVVLAQHSISGVAAGRFGLRRRVPVVLNYLDYLTGYLDHGIWAKWPMASVPRMLQAFERSMPRRYHAAEVLTISDTLADLLASNDYPASRIHPIYYGFDADVFDPQAARIPDGLEPGYVMTHGSLDDFHVSHLLFDAMAHVLRERPRTRFVIVGQGRGAFEKFRDRCAERFGQQVIFTGWVPYAEIPGYLKGAAAGLVPYPPSTGAHHTVVCKLIEYAAMGVPSVCTDLRGTRRFFDEYPGIRFSPFSGNAIGREVLQLLDQPYSEDRPVHEKVREQLNWTTLSSRVADLVEAAAVEHTGKV